MIGQNFFNLSIIGSMIITREFAMTKSKWPGIAK